tara:strand:- start:1190 stop:1474 length:285 start_codon:yes stop_codon:yes gene_type:complete
MKKLLAIIVLGLLWFNQSNAGDYYLEGATPATLMEMGFKLFSITPIVDPGNKHDFIYTFVKDKKIASCRVMVTSYAGYPYEKHLCFNITNIENN